MANGKFLVGKPSGGVTTVTVADGAANTNLVLPESGTVSGVTTAVTDNAIARYDGTTGKLQNSGVIIDDNNNVGIGTSNPLFKLDVTGEDGNSIIYRGTTNIVAMGFNTSRAYVGTISNASFSIDTNGSERMRIDTSGNLLLTSGTGALGYGTGAGGTVTQLTSKSTTVTLNKPSGHIITHNESMVAGSSVQFKLINSLADVNTNGVVLTLAGGGAALSYNVWGWVGTGGSIYIVIKNVGVTTVADSVVISFQLIKGATS